MIGMWWVGGRFESACNGIRVFFCFLFLLKIPFKSPCRAFWCGVRSNGKGRQLITLNKSFLSNQLWNTLSSQGAEDTSVFVILFFVCFSATEWIHKRYVLLQGCKALSCCAMLYFGHQSDFNKATAELKSRYSSNTTSSSYKLFPLYFFFL